MTLCIWSTASLGTTMRRWLRIFATARYLTGIPPATPIFDAILRQAVQHRLPTMFGAGRLVQEGLLMSYGPDVFDLVHGVASYIDRILHGAKRTELPVQFPTKIPLAINLKTAKAIGLDIPAAVLVRADEVIE
jgi:putative ABC transport system substrate-binding protein